MDYRQIEKLVPCPYNSSHQIIPHRLAKHIVKCKKNFPNADMKVCLFNAVHVVPSHQYQAHLLECDSRGLVERELYFKPSVTSNAPEVKPESVLVQNTTAIAEDWETECVQSSYSPEEQSLYKEFVRRTPAGMSKSARKAWRLNEIQRVNRLKNGLVGGDSQSDTNTSAPEITRPSASSGAIQKSQDRLRLESTRIIGQTNQKDLSSDTATAFTSTLKVPNDNDKYQGPKDMTKMTNFIKEKRKLEKKLIEIKKLENMKADSNEKLTNQEEVKIFLKKDIEEKLANLMANVNM
ncbi:uncharacterized protein LOC123509639 [Portunus trituberculatus]|uniref:uncharacterized protein LOC123509639 n=1 Tax=Portunus trituberculatus TaxID=210409 RepID=UPI001E1CE791|nr:uncharacterized protein LOC123509639 [Portunus trituberculatus]XP_045120010.1 uncharacterized protein LOC123509639 [Portunus trituberculatus]XP_045120011.1 uncharacterized protein LOC123509639 [Portunus trituberculatus]